MKLAEDMQIIGRDKRRHNTYAKIAGVLLLVGSIQFLLGVVIGESQYPGYNTSRNTLSDMSGSCPSIDPSNLLKCVNSVVLQPSATIFSTIVFIIGSTIAVSAYLVHKTLSGKIVPILLAVTGIAAMGFGIFPGNAGMAHVYFASTTFYSGSLAAIASYRILKESKPMQYISIALGVIAIIILLSLFTPGGSPFTKIFGVGGTERLVAYPIVLWLVMLGTYLLGVIAVKSKLTKQEEEGGGLIHKQREDTSSS